jgi:hypothetical protein
MRALPLLLALAAPAAAQDAPRGPAPEPRAPAQEAAPEPTVEKVVVRRLSDVVAVREGPRSPERVLYYFDPTVELPEGSHIEQGSGGHTEIKLAGEGLIIMQASAHAILRRLAAEGDVLEYVTITRVEAHAGSERPLQLLLPGHTTVDLLGTYVTVTSEPGRLRVRNEGSTPVRIETDMRLERDQPTDEPAGRMELARGEEVRLVLVGGLVDPAGESVEMIWGTVPVRHTGEIQVLPEGDLLRMQAPGGTLQDDTSILTVRGVRIKPRPGLVVRNPRWVPPPAPPPEQAAPVEPPPAEPPVVEPAAEPPAGENPPPADDEPPPAGDEPR